MSLKDLGIQILQKEIIKFLLTINIIKFRHKIRFYYPQKNHQELGGKVTFLSL